MFCNTMAKAPALIGAAFLCSLYMANASAQVALDVICGKCVDTDDIADEAVTLGKIGPRAVDTENIANEAVTWRQIAPKTVGTGRIADRAVTAKKIASGAVGTDKIQDQAVTAQKIRKRSIVTGKIADGAVTAIKLADDAVYVRTIVVSPLVDPLGTPVENGTELLVTLAGVVSNNPSADDRYLIKLEPGIYDLQNVALEMVRFVDIEGSGEGVTKIIGDVDDVDTGVVDLSRDSEIRFLTVEHEGDPDGSIAISYDSTGTNVGMITHVTARAGGGTPSCALFVNGGAALVRDSRLFGFGGGTSVCVDSGSANIVASHLVGSTVGGATCVGGTYNDTFEMLIEDCATLLSTYMN